MAKIVNRNQQVVTAGLHPMSEYSRVVSLDIEVSQEGGPTFAYTPPLGNNLRVLRISAWVAAKIPNRTQVTTVMFRCGVGKPGAVADIAGWDNLLPKYQAETPETPWQFYDGDPGKSWVLTKLFMGEARRLAISAQRVGAYTDVVLVSFVISEG